jgi:oxygen-independent coproporphyrinogen-3 oxidase
VPLYREAVRAGRLPTARGIAINDDDRLRRDVIEQLMCQGRVDLDSTASRHGADPTTLHDAGPTLAGLMQDGLVQWDGHTVVVPDSARPFLRTVAAAFDRYFRPGAARHARAV